MNKPFEKIRPIGAKLLLVFMLVAFLSPLMAEAFHNDDCCDTEATTDVLHCFCACHIFALASNVEPLLVRSDHVSRMAVTGQSFLHPELSGGIDRPPRFLS